MNYKDSHAIPSSGRQVVYSRNGMVCTGQPLAAQAGLDALRRGGNAVDAAIATAAALTVVEPNANGIGGDAFALVWKDGRQYGLNASGPAPQGLSIASLTNSEAPTIPRYGWEPVTVPGVPAAWAALSSRFGSMPYGDLFNEAIRYAHDGFPVSPVCARYWNQAETKYRTTLKDPLFKEWFRVFAPDGAAPRTGQTWRSADHAKTLSELAKTGSESFYRGKLADTIDAFSKETGGFIRRYDLENYTPEWVDPISVAYKGCEVWELPPNGQGMVALAALGALSSDRLCDMPPYEAVHLQIEALKLAFADAAAYLAEARAMPYTAQEFLSKAYLSGRRALIREQASLPVAGTPEQGGTVYLATADASGTMVSYIQSNYMGFGSGLVVPGTGIALHNRGHNFSTEAGHPNRLEAGKRPYHTIIPGFLTRSGKAVGPFGVMGGFMQPQGHLQVLAHCLDYGLDPQKALDQPRFQWLSGMDVLVEPDFDQSIREALMRRGHIIEEGADPGAFGRGQIIWRSDDGTLWGATEKRTDGCVAAY